jgi:hypothetical protein
VVGNIEVQLEQGEQRPQETLRLPPRQVEDETELKSESNRVV